MKNVFISKLEPKINPPRVVKLRYAHCVKFDPNQQDVEPFSQYELREIEVQLVEIAPTAEYPYVTFEVRRLDGKPFSAEDCDPGTALGAAAYNLMTLSRYEAGKERNK